MFHTYVPPLLLSFLALKYGKSSGFSNRAMCGHGVPFRDSSTHFSDFVFAKVRFHPCLYQISTSNAEIC